ncbi:hypothetical protein ACWD4J_11370 [Streptomyces sp. NPDC002577]
MPDYLASNVYRAEARARSSRSCSAAEATRPHPVGRPQGHDGASRGRDCGRGNADGKSAKTTASECLAMPPVGRAMSGTHAHRVVEEPS